MAKRREFHPALIPALDALIGDPGLISPARDSKLKAEDLYIPAQYIDRIREFRDEQSSRGESATKLLNAFARILEAIHYKNKDETFVCANGMRIHFVPGNELNLNGNNGRSGSTTHALATARYVQEKVGKENVAILTGDSYMSAKALADDIDVAHINPDVYTGRRLLKLPESLYDSWFLFYVRYLWFSLMAVGYVRRMKGAMYYLNPFEIEAYRYMWERDYLERCSEGAVGWREYAHMSLAARMRYVKKYNIAH